MRASIKKIPLLITIISCYVISCRSAEPQSSVEDFQIEDSDQSQNSQDDEAWQNGGKQKFAESKLKMLHPKEPTAWFTRRLIMTAPQPSPGRINECREHVESTVKDAPNLRALDEVAVSLESKVTASPNLYHWCFYQIMSDLDNRLENDTPLMQDKADAFLSRMRILWALARALDKAGEDRVYMRYLKTRYTDINQNLFGRNLETVDPGSFSMPTVGAGKSAAAFEE